MADAPQARPPWYRKPIAWVSASYFAEGYPYALVNTVAETMFVDLGASLAAIGLTAVFHLPWNLKFLWAPWLDTYATKRGWILAVEALLCGALLALVFASAGAGGDLVLRWAAVMFIVVAVLSATHDIAIDGLYLEVLDDDDQSKYVGLRVAAYRVSSTAGAGIIVWCGGMWGWLVAWMAALGLMGLIFVVHSVCLPRTETPRAHPTALLAWLVRGPGLIVLSIVAGLIVIERLARPFAYLGGVLTRGLGFWVPALATLDASGWIGLALLAGLLVGLLALPLLNRAIQRSEAPYARTFVDFLAQDQIGRVLALVIAFRLGESFLLKMRFAFLNGEVGMSPEYFGVAIVTGGGIASIGATLWGGYLIARDGLRRWLWPFMIAQNVLNLCYVGMALPSDPRVIGMPIATVVIVLEHVGSGFGTSVFMVYLMRCCDPRHRATHMAILTALMSLAFTVAGILSGYLAELLGFALYFLFTFVAAIPAMILLPFAPYIDGREPARPLDPEPPPQSTIDSPRPDVSDEL